ncbi:MAG: PP2C family protein-serine/threonine phosphatase [Thioalkalivibrionaceae bacterium]
MDARPSFVQPTDHPQHPVANTEASARERSIRRRVRTAADLLIPTPCVTPDETNEQIRQRFAEHPSAQNLPVVRDGRPIGLVNRVQFHNLMAKPYFPELFARKPCTSFMNPSPIVIEMSSPVAEVTARIVGGGEQAMAEGFILTENGLYRGTGQTLNLISSLLDLQTEQNHLVTESIEYAARIQQSVLAPSRNRLDARFPGHYWLLWRPRDIVGGDIYYVSEADDGILIAVFDCTGHGVPGAFMTLIAIAGLEAALDQFGPNDPAILMASVHRHIQRVLAQRTDNEHDTALANRSNDGLDGIILRWHASDRRIVWASAERPLFIFRPDTSASSNPPRPDDDEANRFETLTRKGDRLSVGYASTPDDACWTRQEETLSPGDWFVLTTDGLIDQIGGGERRQSFSRQRLLATLKTLLNLSPTEAPASLASVFDEWRGDEPPRDDLSLLALRCP